MWSNWADNAKSSMTQALEKTGDAISKAATNAGKQARSPTQGEAIVTSASGRYDQPTIVAIPDRSQEVLKSISQGWSGFMETTKQSIKQAEGKVKEHQIRLQEQLSKARSAYYKRDPSLPLDVAALKDAEVVYITDRLISMSHPAMASQYDGDITGERKLAAVGHLLNRRHGGRFMVWNLSEVEYNIDILDDQVMTFSFPGSPSPPLGLLLKLLISMESWLKADDRNVAVVHCLTGKGRTSMVLAAFLCWMGQAQFSNIYEALEYIAACKQITPDELTIPSQRRYASYFKNMLDGVRPSQPPVMLKRIIMSQAPRYAKGQRRESQKDAKLDDASLQGCVPYLQIFKAGKLLHTVPASLHFQQRENELPFCQVADGNISFHINLVIQGDILVRARHLTAQKKRVSMFRAAFHSGYAPPNVMRMTKAHLDGACDDDRFSAEFFLDFIFEPVDAEEASKLLNEAAVVTEEKIEPVSEKATAVQASGDDTMLHRDSRFWDVIAARKKEQAAEPQEMEDPMWGRTVGRRREFSINTMGSEPGTDKKVASEEERSPLETFSIGGEFDFLPETVEAEPSGPPISPSQTEKPAPKKDSLLEALMGALDDDRQDDDRTEEVLVFDSNESVKTSDTLSVTSPKGEVSLGTIQAQTADPHGVPGETTSPLPEPEANRTSVDNMETLLAEANLGLDDDMDALLADAGDVGLSDDDLLNLDVDDAELDDLESFLSK